MLTLTATQLALLQSHSQAVKAAVDIDITSPLRYCTGADPVQVGGNWYTPRALKFDSIKMDAPLQATSAVVVDDLDGTIRALWYAERFSGVDVDLHILIRSGSAWTSVVTLEWYASTCAFNQRGQFRINLLGGAGTRPRAGLMTGNRTDFMFAPEPGEAMRFGANGGGITFSSGNRASDPPPAGRQVAYNYRAQSSTFETDGDAPIILGPINEALRSASEPVESASY